MKKGLFLTGILAVMLVFGTGVAYAQTVNLDTAIKGAVDELSYHLNRGSKIALLTVRSDSVRMSDYLIEELTSATGNLQMFSVTDRSQLNLSPEEINTQAAKGLTDVSAQELGKKLGVQYVITGTFDLVGNYYRFRLRVIDVATAVIQRTYSVNVQNDQIVASLMGGKAPTVPQPVTDPLGYQTFTTGQRWGTFFLNLLIPGLGSYVVMHDPINGTIQLVAGGTGMISWIAAGVNSSKNYTPGTGYYVGLVVYLLNGLLYNAIASATYGNKAPREDKPPQGHYEKQPREKPPRENSPSSGGTWEYYDYQADTSQSPRKSMDWSAWDVGVLPGKNGIEKVALSYTMRF